MPEPIRPDNKKTDKVLNLLPNVIFYGIFYYSTIRDRFPKLLWILD